MENNILRAASAGSRSSSPAPYPPKATPPSKTSLQSNLDCLEAQGSTSPPFNTAGSCSTDFKTALQPVSPMTSAKALAADAAPESPQVRLQHRLEQWWCNEQDKSETSYPLQACLLSYVERSQNMAALDWLLKGVLPHRKSQSCVIVDYSFFSKITTVIISLPHENAVHYAKLMLTALHNLCLIAQESTGAAEQIDEVQEIYVNFCKYAKRTKDRQLAEKLLEIARDAQKRCASFPLIDDNNLTDISDNGENRGVSDNSSLQRGEQSSGGVQTCADIAAELDIMAASNSFFCTGQWAQDRLIAAQKSIGKEEEKASLSTRVKEIFKNSEKLLAESSRRTVNEAYFCTQWLAIEYAAAAQYNPQLAYTQARSLFYCIKKQQFINHLILEQLTEDTSIPAQEPQRSEYLETLLEVLSTESIQSERSSLTFEMRYDYIQTIYAWCAHHGMLDAFLAPNWRQAQATERLQQHIPLDLVADALAHIQTVRNGWYYLENALACDSSTAHGDLYKKLLPRLNDQYLALVAAILGAIGPLHDKPKSWFAVLRLIAILPTEEDIGRIVEAIEDDSAFSHLFVSGSPFLQRFATQSWFYQNAQSRLMASFNHLDAQEVKQRLEPNPKNWHLLHTALDNNWQNAGIEAYNAVVHRLDAPYARFIATAVQTASTPDTADDCVESVLCLALLMTNEERQKVVSFIFSEPELAGRMATFMVRQYSLNLDPYQDSDSNFALFAHAFLCTDIPHTRDPRYEEVKRLWSSAPVPEQVEFDQAILESPAAQLEQNGRTLFFYEPPENKEMMLIIPKVIKVGSLKTVSEGDYEDTLVEEEEEDAIVEEVDDFEDLVTGGKNNNALNQLTPILGLRSKWPKTVGIVKLTMTAHLYDLLQQQSAANISMVKYRVAKPGTIVRALLCYAPDVPRQPRAPIGTPAKDKAPHAQPTAGASQFAGERTLRPAYATYLHQIVDPIDLQESLEIGLETIGKLASVGIIHKALADLYHDYFILHRKFHSIADMVYAQLGTRQGTGTLEFALEAFAYPNLGRTGVRDTKHFELLENVPQPGFRDDLNENIALMSYLCDALFSSIVIVVGGWYCNWYGTSHVSISEEKLAQIILAGAVSWFVSASKCNRVESEKFLDSVTPWLKLTQEAIYFCSTDYVKDVGQGKVRDGIFDLERTTLHLSKPTEGWHPEQGWTRLGEAGSRSIGAESSGNPLTRTIKNNYTTSPWIFGRRTP